MYFPILDFVLGSSATLKKEASKDAFGNITYTSTSLTNIRARLKTELKRTSDNDNVMLNAKFWYDIVNSRPLSVVFAVDDVITYNGVDYVIKYKSEPKDSDDHHIRLECV